MPEFVPPMLATDGPAPEGPGWAREWKFDGARAIIGLGDGRIAITTRAGNSATRVYPDLAPLAAMVPEPVLLDGEIVAPDAHGIPSFDRLQRRLGVHGPTPELLAAVPVQFYAFDLLVQGDTDLTRQPFRRRRERLWALDLEAPLVQVPRDHDDIDPGEMLQLARKAGVEGIVSKSLDSQYHSGTRSRWWIKTPLRTFQEVIVGGWLEGQGRRSGRPGALLLGAYDTAGALRYLGDVGSGFSEALLTAMVDTFGKIARPSSPFADPIPAERARRAHWLEPVLVGEVAYRAWTTQGHFRHVSWRGFRPDRQPSEITVPVAR